MEQNEINSILHLAIKTFGPVHQKMMAIEECSELINALIKEKRNRIGDDEVITEIADVSIMVGQLALIYGTDKVKAEIERKLVRLVERIKT